MTDLWTRLTNSESLTRKDLYPLCLEAADEIGYLRSLIGLVVDAEQGTSETEWSDALTLLYKAGGR